MNPAAPSSKVRRKRPLGAWERRAAKDPTRFINDVMARPSVGPLAGWIVGGLFALVVWLGVQYAPQAADAAKGAGAGRDQVIPIEAGWLTIGVVSALALLIGWEPVIARRIGDGGAARRRAWFSRLPPWMRLPLGAAGWALWIAGRAPSFIFSLIDYVFARPLAIAAGAKLQPWQWRYGAISIWLTGSAVAGTMLPAHYGLASVIAGMAVVVALVRRWSWVERDREAFLAARRLDKENEEDLEVVRIGFAEDLRDEALTALAFMLVVLIPLGLHQFNLAFDAFDLLDGKGNRLGEEPSWLDWLGFFGAELAKAVPFVDWSEVYNVKNGSPIDPKNGMGATAVFALRASLDLLLLAAVLQAVQIASRLRDQMTAFWTNNLPILDPFAELSVFRSVAQALFKHPHVKPTEQPPVADFPDYSEKRLREIAAGAEPGQPVKSKVLLDATARKAALALLAQQYPSEKTAGLLAVTMEREQDSGLRQFAMTLAVGVFPARSEAALVTLLQDRAAPEQLRETAAREIGRLGRKGASDALIARLSDQTEALPVRAQVGLALVKMGDSRASELVERLAGEFKADAAPLPVMSAAYACGFIARRQSKGRDAGSIADRFVQPLRPHALRAIRSALGELHQMVRIKGGSFLMGSPETEKSRYEDEGPQHEVKIGDFEIGKFVVTFEEYDAFCEATGRELPDDRHWGRDRRPVIDVSWNDANEYCDWLNAFSGECYRLPSEAEWEYACRAGTSTAYSFGDSIGKTQAQFSEGEWGAKNTVEVGSFPANDFGLHDMHGNVWEWCADPLHDTYEGAPTDGSIWMHGGVADLRVVRGGSWEDFPRHLRSACRIGGTSGNRDFAGGFRVARAFTP